MGNSNSMNNLSLIDHKRQTTEFLRYSQIPYESQFRSPNSASHLNIHEIGKLRASANYPPQPNPVKVLPDVKFEPPKLRTTNNGAILQSGGTISGRKDAECGLHRSKSISESQNNYLSPNPNGTSGNIAQPVFKMQRASTQLSINHKAPIKHNLPKHYDDTTKLDSVEVKFRKAHDLQKSHRAPQPPVSSSKNVVSSYRNSQQQQQKEVGPKYSVNPSPSAPVQNQRLFGDTLTKKMDPRLKSSISASTQNLNSSKLRMQKPALETPLNPVKPNMSSYVMRRERTFDMTLMTDVGRKKEEIKPKFSPQFQRKNRQLTTQERYKASVVSPPPPPTQSAINKQRPVNIKSHEKMKTIDRKNINKKKPETSVEQLFADVKNTTTKPLNSTPSNSVSSSFNYVKGPSTAAAQSSSPTVKKQPEVVKSDRSHNTPTNISRESPLHIHPQQQSRQQSPSNNFYYELKETPVDSIETNVDDDDKSEVNHAQMDAVNKFAEDILKMSTFDVSQTEVLTESTTSEDFEDMNILLALRPTLPRRQLQIPHFSPLAAWRSIEIDINNLNDSKNSKLSSSQLQLITEDTKLETKIEKIYREPSFNLQQLDNKSGDSGISADKEVGNSPDSMQIPQAYLISSWTPQQDLEEEEESIDGDQEDVNYQLNSNNQASSNGRMFSLSLPRDNQSASDKVNNFYSLQKFRKEVVEYEYRENNNRIQCHNYSTDNNWLLSSQPNSIDELSPKKEKERNQIISQMRSGKHIMYLPSHWNDEGRQMDTKMMTVTGNDPEMENIQYTHKETEDVQPTKKSSKKRFNFQSTIRQNERRKIAEKLSKEAEQKEQMRYSELEAMQKVEEEFQKKRLREKSRLRQQLRIVSLEENYDGSHFNFRHDMDPDVDTRTPYISKIIEAKSPKKI